MDPNAHVELQPKLIKKKQYKKTMLEMVMISEAKWKQVSLRV